MSESPVKAGGRSRIDHNKSLPLNATESFFSDVADDVSATQASKSNIKVVCRFRPMNERERTMNSSTCVEFSADGTQVLVNAVSEGSPLKFNFDHIFQPNTPQAVVYEAAARPIVESVLEGFNGTVFAYGQTGSGKTFTMAGASLDDDNLKGVIPRMITTVFNAILSASDQLEFTVKIGYCEIYMEKIKDLLNPSKNNLKVHEDKSRGVYIADLTEEYVSDEVEVYNLMRDGTANREVAATQMNEGSSRSHSLFIMTIAQNNTLDFSARTGKLYLVDLAGSEKVGKTGAEGKRLDEAKTINKSLSTLGLVINSLTDGKSTHVPYRDSKLTRVLQDSLGGNSKTSLILTCSPSSYNEAETVSTLRFGIRAKQIKNKPKVNKEYTVAELKLLISKADAEMAKKDRQIALLEKALFDSGGKLPVENLLLEDVEEPEATVNTAIEPPPEMAEMRQELEDTRVKLSETAEMSEEYRVKLAETAARNQSLLKQREDMNKQLTDLLNTIHELEERNNELDDQLQRAHLMQETHQSEIDGVLAANKGMEMRMKELEGEVDRLLREQTVGTRQARLETPRTTVTRMNFQLESKEEEVKVLKEKLENREALLAQLAAKSTDPDVKSLVLASINSTDTASVWELLEAEKSRNAQITREIDQLKSDLQVALQAKVSNPDDVLTHIRREAATEIQLQLDAERSKHQRLVEDEKARHQRELSILQERQSGLLRDLETEQENYRNLENSMSVGERHLKKKMDNLENSLSQLTVLYNQLAQQKSVLKVETQVMEKKLKRKQEENLKLLSDLGELQKKLLEAPSKDLSFAADFRLRRTHKIKKTLKGGKHGNLRKLQTFQAFPDFSGLSRGKPLPDIQEERKDSLPSL